MNKTKTILLYIFFVSFVGCKTKQTSVYIEKVKDSTVRNIVLQTNNELIITNLCDSITGKAKEFSNISNNGLNKVRTSIKDNILTIETKSDSIVYVDKFYKEEIYVDKEKIIYRTDWRIIFILSSLIFLFFCFPTIPRFIKSAVRKFLVWF
jgi:hypothetical protein